MISVTENGDYIDFTLDATSPPYVISAIKETISVEAVGDNVFIDFLRDAKINFGSGGQFTNANNSEKILNHLEDVYSEFDFGTSPAPSSAQEVADLIHEMISPPRVLKVALADFSGDDYTSAYLVGKTADTGFMVFSDNGSGTLLREGSEYSFNSGTGTITIIGGDNIRILIL